MSSTDIQGPINLPAAISQYNLIQMQKLHKPILKNSLQENYSQNPSQCIVSKAVQCIQLSSSPRKQVKNLFVQHDALLQTCLETRQSLLIESTMGCHKQFKDYEMNQFKDYDMEDPPETPFVNIYSKFALEHQKIVNQREEQSVVPLSSQTSMNLSELINVDMGYDQFFKQNLKGTKTNTELFRLSSKFIQNLDILQRQTEQLIILTDLQIKARQAEEIREKSIQIDVDLRPKLKISRTNARNKSPEYLLHQPKIVIQSPSQRLVQSPSQRVIQSPSQRVVPSPSQRAIQPLRLSQKHIQSSLHRKEDGDYKTQSKSSHIKTQCDSNIPSLPSRRISPLVHKVSSYSPHILQQKNKNLIKMHQKIEHSTILKQKKELIQRSIQSSSSIFEEKARLIVDQIKIYEEQVKLIKKLLRSFDFSLINNNRSVKIFKAQYERNYQNSPLNRQIGSKSPKDFLSSKANRYPELIQLSKKRKMLNMIVAQQQNINQTYHQLLSPKNKAFK